MYKLIILFEQEAISNAFEPGWQRFMKLAEKMPGLRSETVSHVTRLVYGNPDHAFFLIHELLFDSKEMLEVALQSPQGREAGQFLQVLTGGKMVLLVAEHREAKAADFGAAQQRG